MGLLLDDKYVSSNLHQNLGGLEADLKASLLKMIHVQVGNYRADW